MLLHKYDDALMNIEDPEHKLYQALAAIKSVEEAELFLKDLCTPMEIRAMADRWRIVPWILEHIPYRQIYDETGVSVTTVGRVARSIEFGSGGYQLIYERVGKNFDEKKSTKNSHSKKRKTQ